MAPAAGETVTAEVVGDPQAGGQPFFFQQMHGKGILQGLVEASAGSLVLGLDD